MSNLRISSELNPSTPSLGEGASSKLQEENSISPENNIIFQGWVWNILLFMFNLLIEWPGWWERDCCCGTSTEWDPTGDLPFKREVDFHKCKVCLVDPQNKKITSLMPHTWGETFREKPFCWPGCWSFHRLSLLRRNRHAIPSKKKVFGRITPEKFDSPL